jgi:ribosomal protein L29
MKFEELNKKAKEELLKILQDNREKMRQLRFDLAAGKVKNVRGIRHLKKEISQILTLLKMGVATEIKAEEKVESSSAKQ